MLAIFGRAADGELSRDIPPGVGCVTATRSRGSLTNAKCAKRKNDSTVHSTGAKRHSLTVASQRLRVSVVSVVSYRQNVPYISRVRRSRGSAGALTG